MRYEIILWDFDGTLVDTSPGIMESIRHACGLLGQPELDESTLRKFIGPPLYFSFQEYAGYSPEMAERATHLFREHYTAGGLYHSFIYPGLPGLLNKLSKAGAKNAVTTLKPENTARLLLSHFQIDGLFAACKGSDPNKMADLTKAQIIGHVLDALGVQDKSRAVLIGDTVFDEEGAWESGVDFIAAAYGFGFEKRPDCVFYAENVESLEKFLL